MLGTLLFVTATVIAVAVGLAARATMAGTTGHHVEDMGRLIGG